MDSVDWIKRAIIYQVFIDRFHGFKTMDNRPEFLGGNINGIIEKLDYLQNLGINVIWLSPFCESVGYHGYHIVDFKKVDSHFGTLEDLKKLIFLAKEKGFRIIADYVPNHCSVEHPFFKDALKNRTSKYSDWFFFEKWPDDYLSFFGFKELAKLNLDHKEARDYMINVADYWLSLGLDGFRIDHAIGPSHSFWKEFRRRIKPKYPEAIFIGEVWCEDLTEDLYKTVGIKNKFLRRILGISQEKVQLEYYRELDGVLDFSLNRLLIESVKNGVNLLSNTDLKSRIGKHFKSVPPDYIMVTFLDNHDVDRFLRHCNGDIDILLSAFELLFSLNHPVVIYNGTETCTYNKTPLDNSVPFSDLAVREPVDWQNINQVFVEGLRGLITKYRTPVSTKD